MKIGTYRAYCRNSSSAINDRPIAVSAFVFCLSLLLCIMPLRQVQSGVTEVRGALYGSSERITGTTLCYMLCRISVIVHDGIQQMQVCSSPVVALGLGPRPKFDNLYFVDRSTFYSPNFIYTHPWLFGLYPVNGKTDKQTRMNA